MKHLILTSAILAALTAPIGAETLTIGTATAQTGGLAYADVPTMQGMKLAVEEINAAGGIDGATKIVLLEKDVRSDPAQTCEWGQAERGQGVSHRRCHYPHWLLQNATPQL